MYPLLKHLHVTCAALSFTGFFVRGLWMLRQSPRLQQTWVKVLPHIIDTMLLGSAIIMAVLLHISPLEHTWLAAKIVALLLYILLGAVALKRGKTLRTRATAWCLSLCVFGYIVSVAITKSPFPFIG